MAKVLYLTYNGLADHIGQAQILPYLQATAQRGHQLHVVSFEKKCNATVFAELEKAAANQGITFYPQTFTSFPPLLSKSRDSKNLNRSASELANNHSFDLVHCRSYVPSIGGCQIKQKHGTPFVFDMRGLWPDQRREGGRWRPSNPIFHQLYKRWKKREANFVSQADWIVSLTNVCKTEIESWDSYRGVPISVCPCSVDTHSFYPRDQNRRREVRERLGISPETLLLMYMGSLGSVYLLKEMFAFFQAMKQLKRDCKFLFLGAHKREELLNSAADHGFEFDAEDLIATKSKRVDIPDFCAAADAGICFITPTYSSQGVSPTKFGEYLACGLPTIINSKIGDTESILTQLGGGVIVPSFENQSLLAAAESAVKFDKIDRLQLADNAKSFVDIGNAIDRYDEIYRSFE